MTSVSRLRQVHAFFAAEMEPYRANGGDVPELSIMETLHVPLGFAAEGLSQLYVEPLRHVQVTMERHVQAHLGTILHGIFTLKIFPQARPLSGAWRRHLEPLLEHATGQKGLTAPMSKALFLRRCGDCKVTWNLGPVNLYGRFERACYAAWRFEGMKNWQYLRAKPVEQLADWEKEMLAGNDLAA